MGSRKTALEKILAISAGILGLALLIQVVGQADRYRSRGPHYMAAWQFAPKSLAELHKASSHVIVGQVANIRRAADIVTQHPGEEGGQDRIPTEIVTLKVEKTVKGSAAQTVEVFRTGLSTDPAAHQPPPNEAPPPMPKGGVPRPATLPVPSAAQANRFSVHDDPGYQAGQRYLLFLADGPQFAPGAQRVVSPEGRLFVGRDNKLMPVSNRGISSQFRGVALDHMHLELQKLQGPVAPGTQFQPRDLKVAPQIQQKSAPGVPQGVPTR